MVAKILFGVMSGAAIFAQSSAPISKPPNSGEVVGWLLLAIAALCVTLNQIFDFYEKRMKEKPSPAATYVTIPNFEKIEKERKQDREKIMDKLDALEASVTSANRYQAKARQGIHRRINAMGNALSFIAGRFGARGDQAGAQAIENKLNDGGYGDEES